ncbi:MAG: peptidyl-prolyl cis-trans isomerase [Lachnospiraceae bacterium]|nr:peptidyl-prolyl cis-trans isomerase [Lachnospiraceae bacterium]
MKRKSVLIGALSIICAFVLSGCTIGGKRVVFSDPIKVASVLTVGDMKCPKEEALVYLLNYRSLYDNIMGASVWDGSFDLNRLSNSVKVSVMDILAETYVLAMDAKDKGTDGLSETEEKGIEDSAKDYYSLMSEKEKEYCSVTEAKLIDAYKKFYIAQRNCNALMTAVDQEVSEDEARVIDAEVIVMSDPEKASKASTAINTGKSFEDVMNTYSEGQKGQISFGRNTYPKEAEDVIFRLENNEVSGLITAGDKYYIVKCINKYNAGLSEENKKNILEKRKVSAIKNVIEESKGKYVTAEDTEFWSGIEIISDEAKTEKKRDSFFSVLQKHLVI